MIYFLPSQDTIQNGENMIAGSSTNWCVKLGQRLKSAKDSRGLKSLVVTYT
jgi:hypothetical protein